MDSLEIKERKTRRRKLKNRIISAFDEMEKTLSEQEKKILELRITKDILRRRILELHTELQTFNKRED